MTPFNQSSDRKPGILQSFSGQSTEMQYAVYDMLYGLYENGDLTSDAIIEIMREFIHIMRPQIEKLADKKVNEKSKEILVRKSDVESKENDNLRSEITKKIGSLMKDQNNLPMLKKIFTENNVTSVKALPDESLSIINSRLDDLLDESKKEPDAQTKRILDQFKKKGE